MIKLATPKDQKYVESLQRRFSNALGFLPRPALAEYLATSRVFLATENDSPAGYVLFRHRTRSNPHLMTIVQTAVQMDAQRRHLGLTLIDRLCTNAIATGATSIQCNCASDLDANAFWIAAGFHLVDARDPMSVRHRILFRYVKHLRITTQPRLFPQRRFPRDVT